MYVVTYPVRTIGEPQGELERWHPLRLYEDEVAHVVEIAIRNGASRIEIYRESS